MAGSLKVYGAIEDVKWLVLDVYRMRNECEARCAALEARHALKSWDAAGAAQAWPLMPAPQLAEVGAVLQRVAALRSALGSAADVMPANDIRVQAP